MAPDSAERYALMMDWHRDRCAICGGLRRFGRGLLTDHDHATGLVRGALCPSCNTQEGCGPDARIELYCQRNPASMWGVMWLYAEPEAVREPFTGFSAETIAVLNSIFAPNVPAASASQSTLGAGSIASE